MNVSLTLDEKPGPLHAFAALDILVLIMLLGFVSTSLVNRSGVAVTLPQSETKFAAVGEALVLTVKGSSNPSYYVGPRPVTEKELIETLRRKRDEEGLRMVLLRADRRLSSEVQVQLSGLILREGLECGLLTNPTLQAPAR